jgi:hypothetical protein
MTILSGAFKATSPLRGLVRQGIQALSDTAVIAHDARGQFSQSIDLDASLAASHPSENRWDYLLGHQPSRLLVGIESHSAKQSEVSVVIAKREAAIRQVRPHMHPHASVAEWYWVSSGRVDFLNHEREVLKLMQNGITFVGRAVQTRHLPPRAARHRKSSRVARKK